MNSSFLIRSIRESNHQRFKSLDDVEQQTLFYPSVLPWNGKSSWRWNMSSRGDERCHSCRRRREQLSVIRLIKCVIKHDEQIFFSTWGWKENYPRPIDRIKSNIFTTPMHIRIRSFSPHLIRSIEQEIVKYSDSNFESRRCSIQSNRSCISLTSETPRYGIEYFHHVCTRRKQRRKEKRFHVEVFFHLKNRSSLDILLSLSSYHRFVCL